MSGALGLSEAEVREMLSAAGLEWDGFAGWIFHQTRPLGPDGESRYYAHDVNRYIEQLQARYERVVAEAGRAPMTPEVAAAVASGLYARARDEGRVGFLGQLEARKWQLAEDAVWNEITRPESEALAFDPRELQKLLPVRTRAVFPCPCCGRTKPQQHWLVMPPHLVVECLRCGATWRYSDA